MPQLGSQQLGSVRLGIQGLTKDINLDSDASSNVTQDIEATFSIGITPSSDSTLTQDIVRPVDIATAISSESTVSFDTVRVRPFDTAISSDSDLSQSIEATFDLSLKTVKRRLAESRLGASRLGKEADFSSRSKTTNSITRIRPFDVSSESGSTLSFDVTRVYILSITSESVSAFSWTLSPSSYEELFGIERGNAEDDLIVRGDAEKTIVIMGNAEID